jgi:hypothetical protein
MERMPNYGYALYKEKNIVIPLMDGKPMVPGYWEVPLGSYMSVYKKSKKDCKQQKNQ